MNWKAILGVIIIIGAIKEFTLIIIDYNSGKLTFWPFGVEIGIIIVIGVGIWLIRKGKNPKKEL